MAIDLDPLHVSFVHIIFAFNAMPHIQLKRSAVRSAYCCFKCSSSKEERCERGYASEWKETVESRRAAFLVAQANRFASVTVVVVL